MKYVILFPIIATMMLGAGCETNPRDWQPTGKNRHKIAEQFDDFIATQPVVETWTLRENRNLQSLGFKDGGFNFLEIWICEPNYYFEFSLYTFGTFDRSCPKVRSGIWGRNENGEIMLVDPCGDWEDAKKQGNRGHATKYIFTKPENYLWESFYTHMISHPGDRERWRQRSLLKRRAPVPVSQPTGNPHH